MGATTLTKTHFDIDCTVGSNGASLLASFNFIAENDDAYGNDGLEYVLILSDYALSSNTSKLVIVQSLKDCSEEYPYSADGDDDTDGDDDSIDAMTTMEPDDTDSVDVRRLIDDSDDDDETTDDTDTSDEDTNTSDDEEENSDSAEEADGVSSDESSEIDVGIAQFLKTGEAHDICYNDLQGVDSNDLVSSNVVYISADQQIQIVFDNFDCTLQLDPWLGFDKTKLEDSSACSLGTMIAVCIAFIAAFL